MRLDILFLTLRGICPKGIALMKRIKSLSISQKWWKNDLKKLSIKFISKLNNVNLKISTKNFLKEKFQILWRVVWKAIFRQSEAFDLFCESKINVQLSINWNTYVRSVSRTSLRRRWKPCFWPLNATSTPLRGFYRQPLSFVMKIGLTGF
jgi:hypothetical protein